LLNGVSSHLALVYDLRGTQQTEKGHFMYGSEVDHLVHCA
jgi:hypothetical protein